MKEITREEYVAKVGSEPEQDDLKRANCPHAGEIGHRYCGWCDIHEKPIFMCGCTVKEAHER